MAKTLNYKNMREEHTLDSAIKAIEKTLQNPRINPAKKYIRKQWKGKTKQDEDKDQEFARALFFQARQTFIKLSEKNPVLLKEPLPETSDPILGLQSILTRYKAVQKLLGEYEEQKTPAETEPDTTPAKCRGIGAWLWRVYEVTVKSFWEAFWEKVLHR